MEVAVLYSKKIGEVADMDIDETADNEQSWEDMVVDASGDFNLSHVLAVVPIEGECTDMQVIATNDSMKGRTPLEPVARGGDNHTHMFQGSPDQSQAIVLCDEPPSQGDRLEIYSGSNKRPYSTPTRLLTHDGFDDEKIILPLLADGSPVDSEHDEPDHKRQCGDGYEISLSATDVPMNLREALQSIDAKQWKAAIKAEFF
uniref:Uncharacterized protein n=1 Tax=Peronospora matthiolae TaxID=2874970 RepID=A0AAV1V8G4_9STRA